MKQRSLKKILSIGLILCFALLLFSGFANTSGEASFTVGERVSGFQLTSEKFVEEIQSKVFIYRHVKSGAKLIFLQNDDDNKVFSIAFKTPASDNTGVNHIIEHSVLDGSVNYPVKSPFLEIGKRSLNTFLNAYTAADSTIYPVASRNEKDFNNLMGIYLDAVFYPSVLKDKRIFLQEAGHYELTSKTSDLSYKGIVYNEMKGNLSSPNSLLEEKITESLFPDTQYKYNSGGTPEAIPTLTWEKLKEIYNKNYQPSNSYIYLYGNIKIKEVLKYIDSKYLSKFSSNKTNIRNVFQKPFTKQKLIVSEYPVDNGAEISKKAFLSKNFVLDKFTNKDDALAFMFLNYLLLGNNGSPLKKALLAAGIGNDVYGNVNINGLQSTYSIIAENADANQRDKFEKIIIGTLKEILKCGLDKKTVSTLIHSYEINLRAGHSEANRGLNYNDLVISSWVKGGDPLEYLVLDSSIEKIKNCISNNYFENLINKYLIRNKLCSSVVLRPAPGLAEKQAEAEKLAFKKKKHKLSIKDLDIIIRQTKNLRKWQETPNSKESLATLPSLNISDIDKKAERIPLKIKKVSGVSLLMHSLYTNKIIYSDMYFDTSAVSKDRLFYLYLLASLLGELDTKNNSYMELANKVNGCLGGLDFTPLAIAKYDDLNTYYPKLEVSFFTLSSNLSEAFDIIQEIINTTEFDHPELMHQYIKMLRASMDNDIVDSGLQIVDSRLQAYYSELGKYNDRYSLPFYNFIIDLDNNYNTEAEELEKNLKEVASVVFNKKNLTASVTCNSEVFPTFINNFIKFSSKLRNAVGNAGKYKFDAIVKNEGYMTTSQVQYIAMGYDINKLGFNYSGKMQVLASILNEDYIWNKIRELGGAYGGEFSISCNGNAEFLSWRDPNLKETMEIFNKAGEYIKKSNFSNRDITNYIISTIGGIDKPRSPSDKGRVSDLNYFSGITQETIQKQRDEILETKAEDIRSYSNMLNKITEQKDYCVFGSKTKILENKTIFNATINVGNK